MTSRLATTNHILCDGAWVIDPKPWILYFTGQFREHQDFKMKHSKSTLPLALIDLGRGLNSSTDSRPLTPLQELTVGSGFKRPRLQFLRFHSTASAEGRNDEQPVKE